MTLRTAKITHLFHSGYAVETAEHYLIFDYYQPHPTTGGSIDEGIITGEFLKNKKNVFVFASHNHGDHFDPIILEWAKTNPNITYILSSDIQTELHDLNCQILSAYEELTLEKLTINSFGSTDAGISFLLHVDGLTIFHAGDLNWWHWSGESLADQAVAKASFMTEMEKLQQGVTSMDIAFFPIDRRMGEFYSLGAEFFAAKFNPRLLVPMHFGNDFSATQAFAQKAKKLAISTLEIHHKGQEFIYE